MCDPETIPGALIEPLKFKPIIHSKIWGGTKIRDLFGKNIQTDAAVGETWELSDNETEVSVISEGTFKDHSFRKVYQTYKADILGSNSSYMANFPLLFKFIDASKNLSVQVHPGENSPLGDPKTEAWYIIAAEKGAEIIVGIKSTGEPDEILEILKTSKARDVLNILPVAKGDVILIPAGTVHAITAGTFVYEVQQNSDTTFRLYDWDRVDGSGKSRDLHIEKAARVLDYSVHTDHKIKTLTVGNECCTLEYLVACDYFAMIKYSNFRSRFEMEMKNRFKVITNIAGEIEIKYSKGICGLRKGETVLIPASCKKVELHAVSPDTELIISHIPNIKTDIAEPLLSAGYTSGDIARLGGRRRLTW